jgi:hypothetical protein
MSLQAWAAAERVGDAARRQAARQVQRREPSLAVPRQLLERHQRGKTESNTTIIEWGLPVRAPTSQEPRLLRDADDFTVIEWTEERKR